MSKKTSSLKLINSIFILIFFIALPAWSKIEILEQPLKIKSVSSQQLSSGETEFKVLIEVPKDHFLYVDDLEIISELEGLNNASFKPTATPVIEFKDKFSNGEIKKGIKDQGELQFTIPFNFNYFSKFNLSYKACTEEFCYLPKKIFIDHGLTPKESSTQNSQNFLGINLNFNSTPLLLVFLLVFLAGFLTSLTPCIFPIIPITLALIRNNAPLGRLKSFQKTCIYVLGLATTYSFLGLFAALSGNFFGSFLSNPYVLFSIFGIYFLLALSMFGLFELQFFANLQNKFSFRSSAAQSSQLKYESHSNSKVFGFGVLTGLFASPCVSPVLIAILTYAAQTQDLIQSTSLLFIYALGLGQIFLFLSLFSGLINLLPKSGPWLNGVKYFLGSLLLISGIYFFLFPALNHFKNAPINYTQKLESALEQGKIVVVDFKAEWCGACKELETKTFSHPEVSKWLKDVNFIQIDVTVTNEDTNSLLQKYNVMGLPHVIFFNKNGDLLKELTISSFITSDEMLERIRSIQK